MSETKIIQCVCSHQFQDERYGKGNRVMNPKAKKSKDDKTAYRCTVCGRDHDS